MASPGRTGRSLVWVALAAAIGVPGAACRRSEPTVAILPPDASLLPVVPPAASAVEPFAREILAERERQLRELLLKRDAPQASLGAAYGQLGKAYQAFDLAEPAAACYENAGRLAPTAFAWPYLLARVRMGEGNPDAALSALDRALAIEPTSHLALLSVGEAQTAAGRTDAARAAYLRVLSLAPDDAPAAFALGRFALLLGDAPEAIRRLEAALAAAPDAHRIHYLLALAYRQVGDEPRSKLHLAERGEGIPAVADPLSDEVAQINPRNYAPRALQALRAGQPGRAVGLLRAASAALPEDLEIRIQLGIALSGAGATSEALAAYREALRLQPDNPRALYYLGATQASLGRNEEAVASLRRSLQRSPGSAPTQLALAGALRQLGRDEDALAAVGEAVRSDPTSLEARLEEGRLLAHLGRCEDAIARIETGVDAFPEGPSLQSLLGGLLATCQGPRLDRDRALRLAQHAFESVASAENAAGVARVLAARGDWSEAAGWQRRGLALLPAASPPRAREQLTEELHAIEAQRLETRW